MVAVASVRDLGGVQPDAVLTQVVMPDTDLREVLLRLGANAIAQAILDDTRAPVERPSVPSWVERPHRAIGSTLVATCDRLSRLHAGALKRLRLAEARLAVETNPATRLRLRDRVKEETRLVDEWREKLDAAWADLERIDTAPSEHRGGDYKATVPAIYVEARGGGAMRGSESWLFYPTRAEWEALKAWRLSGTGSRQPSLPYTLRAEGRLMQRGNPDVVSVLRGIAYRTMP